MANCLSVQRAYHLEYSEMEDTGELRAATVWIVKFDGDTTPPFAQFATDGTNTVPQRNAPHPDYPSVYFAVRARATPISEDTRRNFRVVVEYTNQPQILTSPLGIVNVAWSFQEEGTEPYFMDYDPSPGGGAGVVAATNPDGTSGKYVLNTASCRFQDFLTRATGSITCTYSENIKPSDFDASTDIVPFIEAMNSANLTIPAPTAGGTAITLQPYQARAAGIECDSNNVQTLNGVKYVVYKATFKLKLSWLDKVDSRGFYEVSSTAPSGLAPITKMQPVTAMPPDGWPLDSTGKSCTTITTAPATVKFYPYKPVDLSPIVAPSYS